MAVKKLKVPQYAIPLLGRIIIDGFEDVPGFEAIKAPDVKYLFENKLVAFQKSDSHSLAVKIVLTEQGNVIKQSVLKTLIGTKFGDLTKLIEENYS